MDSGKLEVVKQEMARVNVDILGISELKRTGMVHYSTIISTTVGRNDHYIGKLGSGHRTGKC